MELEHQIAKHVHVSNVRCHALVAERGVEGTHLIQHQDARLAQECTRHAQALPLENPHTRT